MSGIACRAQHRREAAKSMFPRALPKGPSVAQKNSKTRAPRKDGTKGDPNRQKGESLTAQERARHPRTKNKSPIKTVRQPGALKKAIRKLRDSNNRIALVPTMGALHDGHLALVKRALREADRTVVSIFVNPGQFGQNEDLATYPRDEEEDLKALKALGVDLVWAPTSDVMYPPGFATQIIPEGAATGLESDFRPHFFQGVATVVLKLFNQVAPDIAVFGEKDYQQLCVIRQLVRDLDLDIEILAEPTIREKDGLAMSSRNAYLSKQQRALAPVLHQTLREYANDLETRSDTAAMRTKARLQLLEAGFDKVDYVEARDAKTLGPFNRGENAPGRVLAAAWIKSTRLIDNVPIKAKRAARSR